jgi:2-(1,2-epoxy-1,2-dihydrophenyl)acetyl-CoA isomerase
MKDALLEAVGLAVAEPAVRAVVLTGAGKAFCAGQDLRARRVPGERGTGAGRTRRHRRSPGGHPLFVNREKPVYQGH